VARKGLRAYRVQFRCPCGYRNQGVWELRSLHYEADGDPTGTIVALCRRCGEHVTVRTFQSEVLR